MIPTRYRGFTLIELLVGITIIGVLIALILPALAAARQRAIDLQCLTNVRSIAQGMLAIEVDHGRLPRHAAEGGETNLAHAIVSPNFDTRLQYSDYVNVDYFICPHLPGWRPSEATAANVHSSYVLTPGYFSNRSGGVWSEDRWVRSSQWWSIEGASMSVLVMDRIYRWHSRDQNIINHARGGFNFMLMDVDTPANRGMAQVAFDPDDLRYRHSFNAAFTDGSARQYHGSDPGLVDVPDRDEGKDGFYLMPAR